MLRKVQESSRYLDAAGRFVNHSNSFQFVSSIVSLAGDVANRRFLTVGSDGTWTVERLEDGGATVRLAGGAAPLPYSAGGFVDRGRVAVLVRADGDLDIVDVSNGATATMASSVTAVADSGFARDAPIVAIGSQTGEVTLIDVENRRVLELVKPEDRAPRLPFSKQVAGTGGAHLVHVSPSGQYVVLGFFNQLPLLVDRTRGTTTALVGHENVVWAGAIDEEAGLVATGDEDRCIIVWDLATGARLAQVSIDAGVSALEYCGGLLAIGDKGGRTYLARLERGAAVERW